MVKLLLGIKELNVTKKDAGGKSAIELTDNSKIIGLLLNNGAYRNKDKIDLIVKSLKNGDWYKALEICEYIDLANTELRDIPDSLRKGARISVALQDSNMPRYRKEVNATLLEGAKRKVLKTMEEY